MTEVIPKILYLSSESVAIDQQVLQENKIKVVVTCRNEHQKNIDLRKKFYEKLGIEHVYYRAPDNRRFKINKYFKPFETLVNECEEQQKAVLVHCRLGVSRSPTLVISYLIERLKKPLTEVYSFLLGKRRIIRPNIGFQRQLKYHASKYTPTPSTSSQPQMEKNSYPNNLLCCQVPRSLIVEMDAREEKGESFKGMDFKGVEIGNCGFYGLEGNHMIVFSTGHFFGSSDYDAFEEISSSDESDFDPDPTGEFQFYRGSFDENLKEKRQKILEVASSLFPESKLLEALLLEDYEEVHEAKSDSPREFPIDEDIGYIVFLFADQFSPESPFPSEEEIAKLVNDGKNQMLAEVKEEKEFVLKTHHRVNFEIEESVFGPLKKDKLTDCWHALSDSFVVKRGEELVGVAVKPSTIAHYSICELDFAFMKFKVNDVHLLRYIKNNKKIKEVEFIDPKVKLDREENGTVLGWICGGDHGEIIQELMKTASFQCSDYGQEIDNFIRNKIDPKTLRATLNQLSIRMKKISEEGSNLMIVLEKFIDQPSFRFVMNEDQMKGIKDVAEETKEYIKILVVDMMKIVEKEFEELKLEVEKMLEEKEGEEEEEKEEEVKEKKRNLMFVGILDLYCYNSREMNRFKKEVWKNVYILVEKITKILEDKKPSLDLEPNELNELDEGLRNAPLLRNIIPISIEEMFGSGPSTPVESTESESSEKSDQKKKKKDGSIRNLFFEVSFLQKFFSEESEWVKEFNDRLLERSNKGKLKPPYQRIKIFRNEEGGEDEDIYLTEKSETCCGYSSSLVTLDKHKDNEKLVLVGMVCKYDAMRLERDVKQSILSFGSRRFHEVWREASSIDYDDIVDDKKKQMRKRKAWMKEKEGKDLAD